MSTAGRILRNGIRVFCRGATQQMAPASGRPPLGEGIDETDDDDDITAVAVVAPVRRAREISIHDFKDGWTVTQVTHTAKDPSRVWVSLESKDTTLKVSVEEGVARTLRDQIDAVLQSFSSIRNSLRAKER